MEWKKLGGFLLTFGAIAAVVGVLLAQNNSQADALTGGSTTGPWWALAAVGAGAAVLGFGLIVSAKRSAD